jgi:SHS2 domain-containing protein
MFGHYPIAGAQNGYCARAVYEWVEHTGELEVRIESGSEQGVFEEALAALRELISEDGPGDGEPLRREVTAEARDRAGLLAAWLDELVFLAERDGLIPERASDIALEEGRMKAVVEGRRGEPPHLVKAVTYHRLAFEREGDRWCARLVLDV